MIDNWKVLDEKGPSRVAPTFIANGLVDSTSGMIAIETGAIGHNICIVTACSTGTTAWARPPRSSAAATSTRSSRAPRRCRCSRSRTPGSATCAAWARRARASRWPTCRGRSTDPRRVRPRRGRGRPDPRGPRAGDGPWRPHLRRGRGLRLRGRRLGHGPAHRGGSGSARAMKAALERRGVPADEVDVINPHGTSTPVGDKREAEAIWTVFGDRSARDRQVARDQRDQVDDRPHDGRRRRLRGVRDGHGRRGAVRARDDQLPRVRPRGGRVGRVRDASAAAASATPCPTTSASAATTARSSSSAGTA